LALFNIFKTQKEKKENKDIKFKTQIIKTDNVFKTLSYISKKYNLPLSHLDFDILSVETYIKIHKDDDFILLDEETEKLITQEVIISEDFHIKQSYEIKVFKFQFLDDFELVGKFQVTKSLTRATFIISSQSLLNYSSKLESKILNELYKKKLKSQMLVKFKPFEEKLIEDVKKIVTKIRVVGMIEEDFPVTLCEAIMPMMPIKMEVIEHYKDLGKKDDFIKELIYPIKKDELIIEIIKPQEGKNGRNCRGEYIKVPQLKNKQIPEFNINEKDVIKKEDDVSIKYIANKNGYVYLKDRTIFIKDELEVNQISLKTGNVKGAQDSDVRLEIKESDALKEAIRDGMVVETTELLVKGNVGNETKIKAKKLIIEGQTHRNSKIIAAEADINVHKGLLKGKEVLVRRLEGGKIEAEKVHILQAIGGKVIAKEIKIDLLGSHVTLIASDLIEIQSLRGSENKFIIDESKVKHKNEYITKQEETIKELEIKFRQYKEKFEVNKQIILRNKLSINELKEKINEYKKNNLPIKPVWLQKLKKYNDFVKQTKKIEDSLKEIKEKIEFIKNELDKIQNGVFWAKIVSHSGFPEFNRIEFHLIEPPLTLTYDTKEEDKDVDFFMLKDLGEMDYKIVGSKNDSSI
jgi:hypothetical protein